MYILWTIFTRNILGNNHIDSAEKGDVGFHILIAGLGGMLVLPTLSGE